MLRRPSRRRQRTGDGSPGPSHDGEVVLSQGLPSFPRPCRGDDAAPCDGCDARALGARSNVRKALHGRTCGR
jgi:hypothetical protein